MIDLWDALNALYYMHYNYTGVLLNIQRRLQHLRNINVDTKIDEFGQLGPAWWIQMHLFVAILENCRHLGFSIYQSDRITIEMSHATLVLVSQCAQLTQKCELSAPLVCESVTTCPNGNVTTCPSVIAITKFVIVEKYGVPTSRDLYTRFGIFT